MSEYLKLLITGMIFFGYASGSLSADFWWNSNWNYRVSLAVNSADYERFDRPVEVEIDFSNLLIAFHSSSAFDVNSIRIHEVDATGEFLVSENIPFQFDPAEDFDALSSASGTLVFILDGNTATHTNRYFQVYFDIEGAGFTLPTFTSQVDVTNNILDEGQDAYLINTINAEYYYQKQGAGFSSLIDTDQNDWINHHPTGGSTGTFRGIPNLVKPSDGGHFHPGVTTSSSTLLHQGPLKASIRSTTTDGLWQVQWEFFPRFARMTVQLADKEYWFLYEGTPGGLLDSNDTVTRPDATVTSYLSQWIGDLPNQEWVYFSDAQVGKSIFFAHHENDNLIDSYRQQENLMTVFGFGRNLNLSLIQSQNDTFTIGLVDSTDFSSTATTIESTYQDVNVNISLPSKFVDNEAPSEPGNLRGQATIDTVDLAWDAATDNVDVIIYRILLDNIEIGTTATTIFQANDLNSGQNYNFSVIAEDANGNQSPAASLSLTTQSPDTEAPSVPIALILNSVIENAVVISWDPATDSQGSVDSYRVFRDGTEIANTLTSSFTDTAVQANQTYLYSVSAIDDASNESNRSIELQVATPDTEAPTIPIGLTLSEITTNAISFSWTPSIDAQGSVVHYHIFRDGSEISTSSIPSYTDTSALAGITHVYNVTAEDVSGNQSAFSAELIGLIIANECTLDTDGDARVDALTDGLLTIRHMFEIFGASLVNNSVANECTRCSASAVEAFLQQCASTGTSDIDGNGKVDALTDGLLTIRYIFGLRGAALISNAIGDACQRCSAIEVEDYLETLMPEDPAL